LVLTALWRVNRRWLVPGLAAMVLAAPSLWAEEAAPAPAPVVSPAAFDPLRGMDADGRIPKVVLPDGLDHPERWRYVPEGRIKPGGMIDRFLVSTFVAPIVYFEKNVGAGGGISITDIDFREQRRREFAGIFLARTTEGQERYSLVWQRQLAHRELPGGGVVQEERSFLRGIIAYDRTLTRRFFGLGADTPRSGETSYTDESAEAGALVEVPVPRPGDDWVVTCGVRGEHRNLSAGHVAGRPHTADAYPALFAAGDDRDLGWFTAGVRYDTRDSQHNPYRGVMVGVGVDTVPLQDGGGQGAVWNVTGSGVLPVPGLFHHGGDAGEEHPPTDVLAVGGFVTWVTGDLPFWSLPSLGGSDTLRGYIGDRFTGRATWHASAEWRFWTLPRGFGITDSIRVERLGLAPFYDCGSVAGNLSDLRTATVRDSYGLGFRCSFERTALFRLDVGRSREETTFCIAYGLSF
jgi:hypothetical protein